MAKYCCYISRRTVESSRNEVITDALDGKTVDCLRKLPCIPDQALATAPLINLL